MRNFEFALQLPKAPPSFSGSLVGIEGAVELVDGEGEALALKEFVLSATGQPLQLGEVLEPVHLERRKWWKQHL